MQITAARLGTVVLPSCFATLMLALPLFAQQLSAVSNTSDSQLPPAIVSQTRLVLVPVSVRDKFGKHVEHLTKDAFRVEENGTSQAISSFEEIHTSAVESPNQQSSSNVHSNYAPTDHRSYRATIILLDLLNTPTLSQREATKQLLKFLSSSLRQDEPTSLFVLKRSGLTQVASLTTSPAVLIDAVKKVRLEMDSGTASRSSFEALKVGQEEGEAALGTKLRSALQQDSMDHEAAVSQTMATVDTLECLKQLAHVYASIPGRKTLIWATSGFPFMIDDPHSFARLGTELSQEYENTWRELLNANIAAYPVDAEGIVDPHFQRGGDMDMRRSRMQSPYANIARVGNYDGHEQRQATMRAFASATGGRPCIDTNDMEKCFSMAVEDSSSYYILSFYLKPDDQTPGWRKLSVKVSAPGTRVIARQGFYVAAPETNLANQQRRLISAALHSPVEFTGVHFAVQSLPPDTQPATEGTIRQHFGVRISPSSIAINRRTSEINIDVGLFAINDKDRVKDQRSKSLNMKLPPEMVRSVARDGIVLTLDIDLPSGGYVIKTVVHDNLSGHVGTVNFPLEVKTPAESVRTP